MIEPRADVAHLAPDFGVYVHIPYCISRCPYCDFNTYVGIEDTTPAYVDALLREAAAWPRRRTGSIFLGGGTPSLLEPDLVRRPDVIFRSDGGYGGGPVTGIAA